MIASTISRQYHGEMSVMIYKEGESHKIKFYQTRADFENQADEDERNFDWVVFFEGINQRALSKIERTVADVNSGSLKKLPSTLLGV